jgi:hypothetical protein
MLLAPNEIKIWGPNPGRQHEFVANVEREVLYGGAAGGGKSDGLLGSALLEYKNRAHRAIIFRKTFGELKDLIDRSHEVYPALRGRYKSSAKEWRFPSGAMIEFGHMEKMKDVYKYKRAWNFIGFDELTHWPTTGVDPATGEPICFPYLFLLGRLRSVVGSGCKLRIRATTNPGGAGHEWVRARFKIPDDGGASEVYDYLVKEWRLFIPSRIADNPFLSGTPYEDTLNALPEDTRKMMKDGRWDVVAGAMFSEFDHRIHVCDPFPIPIGAKIWRGGDDGFNAPAAVYWGFKLDGRTYIAGELYKPGLTPEAMAEEVLKRDRALPVQDDEGVIVTNEEALAGSIDSSAFNEIGVSNARGTGRGQIMNTLGCRWQPAQKGPGSRIAGANLIHSYLREKLRDGKPKLIIFRNCTNLIRTLPTLPKDPTNPEDVDTEAEDHAYDGLRYFLQHKPNVVTQKKLSGT